MSDTINTKIIEWAEELADYFEGTTTAKMLREQIEQGDLETLYETAKEADKVRFDNEFSPRVET